MKYWNGYSWRHIDDDAGIDIPTGVSVLTCEHYPGATLDPVIHVITSDESQPAVIEAHERYRRSEEETPPGGVPIAEFEVSMPTGVVNVESFKVLDRESPAVALAEIQHDTIGDEGPLDDV